MVNILGGMIKYIIGILTSPWGLFSSYVFGGSVRTVISLLTINEITVESLVGFLLDYFIPATSVGDFILNAILNIAVGLPVMGILWALGMFRYHRM